VDGEEASVLAHTHTDIHAATTNFSLVLLMSLLCCGQAFVGDSPLRGWPAVGCSYHRYRATLMTDSTGSTASRSDLTPCQPRLPVHRQMFILDGYPFVYWVYGLVGVSGVVSIDPHLPLSLTD